MYVNKWLTFTVSVPLLLSSGVTYSFAVWSDELKRTYGLDQSHIQAIGSVCNLGGFSGIISGIVYDLLEPYHGLGPRLTIIFGAFTNLIGYLGLWAAATRRFHAAYWQLLVLAFVACNGGTWADTSCLVTNVRNFPSHKGMVVGVLKSGVGLSAALYTAIYLGLLSPLGPSAFLLLLALVPSTIAVLAAVVTNYVPFVQQSELEQGQHVFTTEGRFLFALQAVGALAIYLMTTTLAEGLIAEHPELRLGLTVGALLLLLPLLLIPNSSGGIKALPAHPLWRDAEQGQLRPHDTPRHHLRVGHLVGLDSEDGPEVPLLQSHPITTPSLFGESEVGGSEAALTSDSEDEETAPRAPHPAPLHASPEAAEARGSGSQQGSPSKRQQPGPSAAASPARLPLSPGPSPRKVRREVGAGAEGAGAAAKHPAAPNLSPLRCLLSLNFWLLFSICAAGMGAGLAFNNNLAQLVRALGGKEEDGQDVFVSLFGICNCAGRLLLGFVPERMLHIEGLPRPFFLIGSATLTTATCLFLAVARLPALYPLAMLSGLAYGSYWSLMPSLASELFGLTHFASNYALLQVAPAIASFELASRLAGYIYQRAIVAHGGTGNTCRGQDCFQLTFLVISGLGLVAIFLSSWLYLRTRDLYYTVHYAEVHQHDHDMEHHPLMLPPPTSGGEDEE